MHSAAQSTAWSTSTARGIELQHWPWERGLARVLMAVDPACCFCQDQQRLGGESRVSRNTLQRPRPACQVEGDTLGSVQGPLAPRDRPQPMRGCTVSLPGSLLGEPPGVEASGGAERWVVVGAAGLSMRSGRRACALGTWARGSG